MISFVVPGEPIAQPRQRHTRTGRNYIPAKHPIHAWKMAVAAKCPAKFPIDGEIRLRVSFYLKRPKAMKADQYRPCTKKPDLDNLQKAVCDALNGIAWNDDSQVTEIIAQKKYSSVSMGMAVITIEEIEQKGIACTT